jgi:sulfur carrier protein ThiS
MEIKVKYRDEIKFLKFDKDRVKVIDILKALKLSPDYAFIVKGDEILREEEIVDEMDDIEVISAISGG